MSFTKKQKDEVISIINNTSLKRYDCMSITDVAEKEMAKDGSTAQKVGDAVHDYVMDNYVSGMSTMTAALQILNKDEAMWLRNDIIKALS